ncbi:hypothetical protein QP330_10120, partial [Actinotignum timonense]|uniref:hypothetical protein n=1 Tax=Actinotignum timonense TaxID=1870995 RepID=UPI00254A88A5|nr:hypothetical protein [Actinotignum timonense]
MGNNIYPGIKTAYCYTCKKPLHYLGIAAHRALHHRDLKRTGFCSYLFLRGLGTCLEGIRKSL